jgi:peptide/nickel transport system permease protein
MRRIRRLADNRFALAGGVAVALVLAAALAAPWLAPADYARQDLGRRLAAPGGGYWLGADGFGRDVLSRLLWGARVSLAIGAAATVLTVGIGGLVGAVSGYAGGLVDHLLMRVTDAVMSVPPLLFMLVIVSIYGAGTWMTPLVIGVVFWPGTARLVRAEVLRLRGLEFVEAARGLGLSPLRLLGRHVLPNALTPVLVQTSLIAAEAVLLESGLSYLGLGAQPPLPSWGNMLAEGRSFLDTAWWVATFPGLAIFVTVLGMNIAGDGLRDALDPRAVLARSPER